jgi:uncharacterized membrane protein YgaE (UPF0421/DUF939 family)
VSFPQLPRADSTLIYLLVACCFITIWLVGAGWIDVERIQRLTNLVIGLGIGTGIFSLAQSYKTVSRETSAKADDKVETVRAEMQAYYRNLLDDAITKGMLTQEQLAALETTRQIKNGDTIK